MKSVMHQLTQDHTLLKDIRPMMRKLDIEVIVLQQESETVVTRNGKYVYWYLVADKSGVMVLKAWGPSGGMIKSGDILHISGIENKMVSDRHLLEVSRQGKIQRLGQDTFPFAENPNFSQPSELTHGRPPIAAMVSQSPNTNAIDQRQQFHQSSPSIRPPPPTNYIASSSLPFDNGPSSSTATMNFGPGWMGGLGRNHQRGGDERALPTPNMEQQGNHYTNKRLLMDGSNNKENTTMNRRKVGYNELV